MTSRSTVRAKITLVFAIVGAAALWGGSGLGAYTVVTRDGHLIPTQSRPEIRGLQAYMRLAPRGELAVIQEELIDWNRTDAANPAPAVIAVPADARMTQGVSRERAPSKPIDVKIVGTASGKPEETAPSTGKTAEQKTTGGETSPDQKKVNAQEAIIKLQKEFAQVATLRDTATQRKKVLETELSQAQSKSVGYASEDSASAKRVRELQQQIAEVTEEVGRCEARMDDIRAEAIQLGGSID